ncbi:hypothetical protein CFC21_013225 [Triticum aestivum]|uniref:non-specific serine/threonine protein kinase n=2 Tax=Triticum aestivum TaxID=4565 RepID=A0A9R1DRQ4_WHEAT|nr:probable LRR receptor-like serine/threonine-protein kinase At1g05700 [Triticum aestivum]KAF6996953.1 hypothetical protein CFC21_013225 [Triticum aestivum]
MEQSTAASPWLLLLCLLVAAGTGGVLQARAQLDSKGFISVDCGLPGKASYVDGGTKLSYVSDAGFIDDTAGANHNISGQYIRPQLSQGYQNVRSFPDGTRNCYTLRSLVSGRKYLVRAAFLYGDYDGLGRPPIFDLHLGVNYWQTVNVSTPGFEVTAEAIVVVPDDFVQVCLVNTGAGTPFVSALELRPLKMKFYPQANLTQGLVLDVRLNLGPADVTDIVRYPEDPHDRVWIPWADPKEWTEISTTKQVDSDYDDFEVPTAVMQTALTPLNASMKLELTWDPVPQPHDLSPGYFIIMHFSELQLLPSNALRQFDININGVRLSDDIRLFYLGVGVIYNENPYRDGNYNISINATANSTLPPILNALELFSIMSTTNFGTDSRDVSAITTMKAKYHVQRNWMGDPCSPKIMAWEKLMCSYDIGTRPRIRSVNLSSSGLNGDISSSFANLKALQYLDLSNNNLTGTIPDTLSQLPLLKILDLSGNQLSGSIPSGILKKVQDGSLNLRYGNNSNLCTNANSCQPAKMKSKLPIYVGAPTVAIMTIVSVALILFCLLRRKTRGLMKNSVKPQNETRNDGDTSLGLETRRFTYNEIERITNNLQQVLGKGGFGYVYDGFLEDGTQVAVKIRSESSNQGDKEFLAEVQILTRIHHKNLVSLIGFCKDGEHMALVYEFMSEGTLQDHIVGGDHNARCLTWRQRLQIAVESAQGLEYLHKGCNPPLIHRDVKATNILLNMRLEAKIADFGLSKAFNRNNESQVSTDVIVGTRGYMDPEYQTTGRPTTKSDVYSFGVVLLVLVTGKPPTMHNPRSISIIEWVQQRLSKGNIEGVVDVRMHGDHDINGMWKAADIALKCTAHASARRPNMTDVVLQLQECLKLEEDYAGGNSNNFYTGIGNNDLSTRNDSYPTNQSTNVSQSSTSFEKEHNFGRVPTMDNGPAAR